MASDWAIVAAAGVGGTVPLGIEWIRERGRRKEAAAIRNEEAAAAKERASQELLAEVVLAVGNRLPLLNGDQGLQAANSRLYAAICRLALEGAPAASAQARLWLTATERLDLKAWVDQLVELVNNPA